MSTAAVIDFPDDNNKPSASLIYVTPDMAERWLTKNTNNRTPKKEKIRQYARDMTAGRWEITGEAVKFAKSGRLIDGQNRLFAVVESGATVPLFVIRGIEDGAQLVMDSGSVRSNGDALGFSGYAQPKDLAPAASALAAWRAGHFKHCMVQSNPRYTKPELVSFIEANPMLAEITPWAKKAQRELPLPVGSLAACAHEFMLIDTDAATDFYDRIREMNLGPKSDPINTLVRRVVADRTYKKRIWASTGIFYLTRAWNAYRDLEPLTKLQLGSDSRGWTPIPKPH